MYKYDVFVSYNSAHVKWVQSLVEKLRERGVRPFFDREVGLGGRALLRAIAEGLESSRCVIVVLTPQAIDSKFLRYEVQKSRTMDPDSTRRFVIPLLLRDCELPD